MVVIGLHLLVLLRQGFHPAITGQDAPNLGSQKSVTGLLRGPVDHLGEGFQQALFQFLGLLLQGQQLLLGLGPVVRQILPYMLVMPTPDGSPSVSGSLAIGQQPDSYLAVFIVTLCIVVFVAVSIWRFEREEF